MSLYRLHKLNRLAGIYGRDCVAETKSEMGQRDKEQRNTAWSAILSAYRTEKGETFLIFTRWEKEK